MIRSIDRTAKDKALADLESDVPASDFDQMLTLIAELKVMLIADDGAQGGLNAENRARAWCIVRDLGKLLLKLRDALQ
jgi:hypothetical protein